MNTRSQTAWGVAVATITMSAVTACGSEVTPPSNDIGGVHATTDVRPEQGTARLQDDDSGGVTDRASQQGTARLQFPDNGGY